MDPLLDFLSRYFDINSINDQTDLFQSGLVNSLFSMQLLMFLEKQYHITINNDDLNIDNFKSIQAIRDFTRCKARQ